MIGDCVDGGERVILGSSIIGWSVVATGLGGAQSCCCIMGTGTEVKLELVEAEVVVEIS